MNRQNTRDMDQDFDQNYQGNRGYRGDYDREYGDWYGGPSNRSNFGGQGYSQGGYHPSWGNQGQGGYQQGWNQGWGGQGYGQGGYNSGWNPRWGGQDYYGQGYGGGYGYGYNSPFYGSQGYGQGGFNQGWGNQGWSGQGGYQQGWNQGWGGQGYGQGNFNQGWNNRRWQNRWPQNDQEIEDFIYEAIDDDPNISNEADINVEVNDGIVTLTGTVRSWRTKYAAGNCAWMAPGVRDVNNNVSVAGRTRSGNKSGFNTDQTATNGTNMKGQNMSTAGRK